MLDRSAARRFYRQGEDTAVQVRFWGTRGSLAKPGAKTVRYGGNTSCVEVRSASGARLVFDCGTGGHELGVSIMREGTPSRGHMLISHTHWDHIQGIPFFAPFFVPGHQWNIYAPQGFGESIKDTLAGQMEYTYFPVTTDAFGADVQYNNLGEGSFVVEDFVISTRYLNHPALALAFRVECDGAVLVYACDHEPHDGDLASGAVPLTGEDLAHARFMADADLIIHDAQYLIGEYDAKRGWGHSTVDYAVAVARAAGAKKVALTHHDPMRSDDEIDATVARLRDAARPGDPEIVGAAEGTVFDLGDAAAGIQAAGIGNAPQAVRDATALVIPRLLLVADDDTLAERIIKAANGEVVELTRVCSVVEGAKLATALRPGLVLVEDALAEEAALTALGAALGDEAPPVVLLGGHGPTPDGAVDRLDEPWSGEYARTRIRTWLMRSELRWARPEIPVDDAERLAALRSLEVLDTAPEERFDRTTRLAAALFRVPVALVSLVDTNRQWFKSRVGIEMAESPRDSSFCAHAVAARAILVIPDALADNRFRDNPIVTGTPRVRFYAGVPLHLPDGHIVGTLCILDYRPRGFSAAERGLLADLAATVEAEFARVPALAAAAN